MTDQMDTLRVALDKLAIAISEGQTTFDLGRHYQNCMNRFMEVQAGVGILRGFATGNATTSQIAVAERPWQLEAIKLIGTDKKVAAIKYCRERTGLALKEAKDLCDELHNEFFIVVPAGYPNPYAGQSLGDLLRNKLKLASQQHED